VILLVGVEYPVGASSVNPVGVGGFTPTVTRGIPSSKKDSREFRFLADYRTYKSSEVRIFR
jgi:hypothetical protein